MGESRLNYLYQRYQSGELTDTERHEWESMIQGSTHEEEIQQLLDKEWQNAGTAMSPNMEEDLKHTYAYIIAQPQHKKQKLRKLTTWMKYAAAVLVIAGTIFFVAQNRWQTDAEFPIADVLPGGNKAFLTLADGTVVNLSQDASGIVVGNEIAYEDGTLVLDKSGKNVRSEMLQLLVPKGGTYAVTLHDGTKVWLNSGSTLRYPAQFTGNTRVVELEGEAFFDVRQLIIPQDKQTAKKNAQKIPFFVKTSAQLIEVVGTQFNVSAYADGQQTATTLVEGAVKVGAYTGQRPTGTRMEALQQLQLMPNEQAIVNDGKITKKTVDVDKYVAWKIGMFYFDETDLGEAMDQLSRWYDVEIIYSGTYQKTYFYGEISRRESLKFVLDVLQTSGLKFKIINGEGRSKLVVL